MEKLPKIRRSGKSGDLEASGSLIPLYNDSPKRMLFVSHVGLGCENRINFEGYFSQIAIKITH